MIITFYHSPNHTISVSTFQLISISRSLAVYVCKQMFVLSFQYTQQTINFALEIFIRLQQCLICLCIYVFLFSLYHYYLVGSSILLSIANHIYVTHNFGVAIRYGLRK